MNQNDMFLIDQTTKIVISLVHANFLEDNIAISDVIREVHDTLKSLSDTEEK